MTSRRPTRRALSSCRSCKPGSGARRVAPAVETERTPRAAAASRTECGGCAAPAPRRRCYGGSDQDAARANPPDHRCERSRQRAGRRHRDQLHGPGRALAARIGAPGRAIAGRSPRALERGPTKSLPVRRRKCVTSKTWSRIRVQRDRILLSGGRTDAIRTPVRKAADRGVSWETSEPAVARAALSAAGASLVVARVEAILVSRTRPHRHQFLPSGLAHFCSIWRSQSG